MAADSSRWNAASATTLARGRAFSAMTALEEDWARPLGRQLVRRWCKMTGLWDLLDVTRPAAAEKINYFDEE